MDCLSSVISVGPDGREFINHDCKGRFAWTQSTCIREAQPDQYYGKEDNFRSYLVPLIPNAPSNIRQPTQLIDPNRYSPTLTDSHQLPTPVAYTYSLNCRCTVAAITSLRQCCTSDNICTPSILKWMMTIWRLLRYCNSWKKGELPCVDIS